MEKQRQQRAAIILQKCARGRAARGQKENPDPELGKDLGKEPHEEQGTEQSKDQKEEITQKFGLGINII